MYEIGRLCVKIAGRDAGKKCIVVEALENNLVLIDGQTRRRKCNINHLEPLSMVFKIKKGTAHGEVVEILKKEGIEVIDTKPKSKAQKPQKAAKTGETKEEAAKKTPKPKAKKADK